jgi:hypothetical protein
VEASEFVAIRKSLSKTQKQMAELLGVSIKAVHSYEQGWRTVPAHVERQIYFLLSRKRGDTIHLKACWNIKKCPPEQRKRCPAWEFRSGTVCWFINGTICEGEAQINWKEKMKVCRKCEVLASLLPRGIK